MLKIAFAVLAVALASTASAAGWRSLRVDASSEAAYSESMAVFQDKLSPSRRHAFARALQEIWTEGAQKTSDAEREYTKADYFAQLDGLAYEEVVTLLDPTGDKAKRYRAEYYTTRIGGRLGAGTPVSSATFNLNCCYPLSAPGANWRGGPQTQRQ